MSPQPPKPPPDDDVIKEKSDAEKSFEAPKPQIVKVKADKEFVPEKVKPEKEKIEVKEIEVDKFKDDNEKPLEKLKPEKETKLEAKEIEKVKRDDEKLLEKVKPEKEAKLEAKEIEGPFGGVKAKEQKEGGPEGLTGGASEAALPVLDTDELLRHAKSLEESGRQLRHFIERSLRPDLSEGALANEDDLQDTPEGGSDDD